MIVDEIVGVARRRVARHRPGRRLQLDRRLGLERDPRPAAEQRGHRVEQPADGVVVGPVPRSTRSTTMAARSSTAVQPVGGSVGTDRPRSHAAAIRHGSRIAATPPGITTGAR